MTSALMVRRFLQMADNLDSKNRTELPAPQIIEWLNDAQMQLITEKYGPFNKYSTGFEGNEKRSQELRILLEPVAKIKKTKVDEDRVVFGLGEHEAKIMYNVRVRFKGDTSNCNDIRFSGIFVQTDDLNNDVYGPFLEPSLAWREIPYRMTSEGLEAFQNKELTLDMLLLEYLRYPKKIDVKGYTHIDGSASVNQDCELPALLHEGVVRRAVTMALATIPDPRYQSIAAIGQQDD